MAAEPGSVAVVVPMYRDELTPDERISVRHLLRFLGRYDRYLVVPRSVRPSLGDFGVRRFPDRSLRSRRGYSALLLSRRFYRAFADYEYILVYQLDSLVFRDELADWCARGYDYIGAMHRIGEHPPIPGNGGFSLRRVPTFLRVLTSRTRTVDPAEHWRRHWAHLPPLTRLRATPRRVAKRLRAFNSVGWEIRRMNRSEYAWPEDWFWSLEARKYVPEFRIPSAAEGIRFAFAEDARSWLEAAAGRLPFGCHGWDRSERELWEPYLLRE